MTELIYDGPWFLNLLVYVILGVIPIALFFLALFLIFWSFSVMSEGYISPINYYREVKDTVGRYIFGD